ncbi:hypothetical protein [Wolbachia endosymbiont of Litomosoides sigmodontis]|nr:hypothetical protein [Wolbachia endosymbiont of Litomosoides sigmodontis]
MTHRKKRTFHLHYNTQICNKKVNNSDLEAQNSDHLILKEKILRD